LPNKLENIPSVNNQQRKPKLLRHTSAFAKISHPVASESDLILMSGVLPMQPSIPSTMGGG
jgi:hypothetical protein